MRTIEKNINYTFKSQTMFDLAMTHRSSGTKNNERLEFLGDAVLDLVVGEYLFSRFKNQNEGNLSKLRASLVNEASFAKIALKIGIDQKLKLSAGERKNGGAQKPSILSDALEAMMGVIYLENGIDAARKVFVPLLESAFPNIDLGTLTRDFKTQLQELTQAHAGSTPTYILLDSSGPDHQKTWIMSVSLNGTQLATAEAKSKKEAEQIAAKAALEILQAKWR